jgi:non-heme chloroperoxidase
VADQPVLPAWGERRCQGLEVGASSAPDQKGPHPVGVRTLELDDPLRPGRTLTTEVWYPADASVAGQSGESYSFTMQQIATMMGVELPFSLGGIEVIETDAVRDAPRAPNDPSAGLVVFSHGFRGIRFQSTFLTVFLASHGYVVAAPDHKGNTLFDDSSSPEQSAVERVEDMAFVTTALVRLTESSGDFFAKSFDPRRVAWTGHSFGASTVIMAGALDNREMVNIPLAPAFDERMALVYNTASYDLRAATFIFGAVDDGTTPPPHQQLAYDRTFAPRYLTMLDGARHSDFTDICTNTLLTFIPVIGDNCGANPAKTQEAVRTMVTAALHRYLRCDPGAEAWLEPTAVSAMDAVDSFDAEPGAGVVDDVSGPLCDLEPGERAVEQRSLDIERDDAPKLHVEVTGPVGDASAIVFIHGHATTGAVFAQQVDTLSSHYRVVTLDLRGHGKSGLDPTAPFGVDGTPATPDDPYRLESYVEDVEDVLEALDLSDAVLVGWSSGGQVAASVALGEASQRVRALVLVGTAPLTKPDPSIHPTYNGGATLEFAFDLRLALAGSDTEAWRPVVANFFARDPATSLVDDYFALVTSIDMLTRLGQTAAARPDLVDVLGNIAVPTLIVHGEQDDASLLESARFMAGAIAGSELVVFQRSGHAPFAEEPERFNQVLADFVGSL